MGFGWSPRPLLGVAHKGFFGFLFFGLVGLFGRPSRFFPRPSGLNLFGLDFSMSRARTFPCTVSVDVSGLAAQGSSRPGVVSAIVVQFHSMPIAAVQFFGTEAKVTFERQEHKRSVMQHESVSIRGVDCDIRGGGPRPQNVLIYNFPYEIGHDVVKTALRYFGDVEYVRFPHWTHLVDVCDGVRTVRMVRTLLYSFVLFCFYLIVGSLLCCLALLFHQIAQPSVWWGVTRFGFSLFLF